MEWEEKKAVIKGTFAEEIINKFLESKGFVVYAPETEGPHAFDRLAIRNKETIIIAECKAKAKRNYYDDTGINIKHYNEYKKIQAKHNLPVFIFFIDEMLGKIYGNFIKRLEKPTVVDYRGKNKEYPSIEGRIIYFPLCLMINVATLTAKQVGFLKEHSTRKYQYV